MKEAIVAGSELDTEMIFRPLRNTARVASNAVSREVVEILNRGGQFEDVKDLVAGSRGVKVYEVGDLDAGIWSVGTAMGLINDIPTCGELVSRIVDGSRGDHHRQARRHGRGRSRRERRVGRDFRKQESTNWAPHRGKPVAEDARPLGRAFCQTAVGSVCSSSSCSEVSPSTRKSPW